MINREAAKELFRSDKDAHGKPRGVMRKLDEIYDSFEETMNEAKILLQKSLNHLDRDFNWEDSDKFEKKINSFLKKNQAANLVDGKKQNYEKQWKVLSLTAKCEKCFLYFGHKNYATLSTGEVKYMFTHEPPRTSK